MMRIGLVGCGRWGTFILRDLLALGCDVTVVERTAAGRDRAEGLGADAVDQLVKVDGVVVATPIATHASVIHQAMDLGLSVFTERALTDDVAAADSIVERGADKLPPSKRRPGNSNERAMRRRFCIKKSFGS